MRNIDYGIFYAVFICRDEGLMPGYLLKPLIEELNWFKEYLPSPDDHCFDYCGHNVGICWFREDAHAMIRRARRMVNILRAGDI